MVDKKYYWLKLNKDFFKRHDITVIEDMKNGKDYVLFYLKLLVESLSHEGNLRFSDTIPYNEDMLASVTRTNIDIVRSAIKIFTELQMMEKLDDGTIFMNEVQYMIGAETEWAEKKRIYRENLKTIEGQKRTLSDKSKSIELEKELDKEKDNKDIVAKATVRFIKPTLEEVSSHCKEKGYSVDPESFIAFYESKGWKIGNSPMKSWQMALVTWEKRNSKPKKKEEDKFNGWNFGDEI